ncbi:MAG: Holliday junction resolvase RuvX [Gemmataceae bacterium]|nr:Holliday junction resolvase RuvX [Gemmataceae bacterium]
MSAAFPPRGRLLGVDFGTVRIGLAVSDPDRVISSPLQTYTRLNPQLDATTLKRVAAAEGVVGLVIGLPLHTGGEEGKKAAEARAFGAWLGGVTQLPAVFWDERFTTAAAEDALWDAGLSHRKRRDRRDRVAAQLILQAFLDAGCPPEGTLPDPPPPTDETTV